MVDVTRIRFNGKGMGIFSPLEEEILGILWKKGELRVREVHTRLGKRKAALTSVAVSLDRLHTKRAVGRRVEDGRGGAHYIYYPAHSKSGFERSIVESSVNKLISNFGGVAVSYFDERFGKGRKKR